MFYCIKKISLLLQLSSVCGIKLMTTQRPLLFFPARVQRPLPSEMYNQFLTKMRDTYDVHVAGDNVEKNKDLLSKLKDKYLNEEICLLSHSSGSVDLLKLYVDLEDKAMSDKMVLIEPIKTNDAPFSEVDDMNIFKFDLKSFNDNIESVIETDYFKMALDQIFGSKKNGNVTDVSNGELLVLRHANSDKWRFVPTIPPLSFLVDDLSKMKNVNIQERTIDKYSHFDLLDRPWANIMNRAMMSELNNDEEMCKYHEIISEEVFSFYSD